MKLGQAAMAVLVAVGGIAATGFARGGEIAPLPLPDPLSPWLRPIITERGEIWGVRFADEHRARHDERDGTPTLCAWIFRARSNATDPAFESLEIGVERDAAASTPTKIEGTVYLRVRFADATTWKTVTPDPLVVWFDDNYSTGNWRVDPPDGQGYIRLSKTLAELGEKEREAIGWALGDSSVDVAIQPTPGGRWRIFNVGGISDNPPEPPAQAMRDCVMAMGDDELTLPTFIAEARDAARRDKAEYEMKQEKEPKEEQEKD